jgi:hypothetical protein
MSVGGRHVNGAVRDRRFGGASRTEGLLPTIGNTTYGHHASIAFTIRACDRRRCIRGAIVGILHREEIVTHEEESCCPPTGFREGRRKESITRIFTE